MVLPGERSGIIHHLFKSGHKVTILVLALTFPLVLSSCGGLANVDPVVEAEQSVTSADPFMGDWQGEWQLDDGADYGPLVAQVIALGKGKYSAILNWEFDTRNEPVAVLTDDTEDDKAVFKGQADSEGGRLDIEGKIEGDKFAGTFKGWDFSGKFELTRTIRVSPTMGAKAPSGAVVLYNGKNFKQWQHTPAKDKPAGRSVEWNNLKKIGVMEVKPRTGSIVTKKKFTDFKMHVEFRTPFMPEKSGQGRANSGVYLQGRYEVQVLDSYALEGEDNECGGIYKVGKPIVNMCAPPAQWQTYDITFHAPKSGNPARTTVVHNGVTIHDEIELKLTGGALDSNVNEPGGIYLQDHGNPMQFRNIWLVEL